MIWILVSIVVVLILLYSVVPTYCYKLKTLIEKARRTSEKTLYITFDDGPEPEFTNILLNTLRKYDVKATFFVVAKSAQKNSILIDRIKNEGHLIGLHSLEHKNAMIKGPLYTNKDFKESIEIMRELNVDIKYYRPPWGHFNLFTMINIRKYNLKPALWDVIIGDWKEDVSSDIIERSLIKRIGNNSYIICLHDGRGRNDAPLKMVEALNNLIPAWLETGYQFMKIDS